MKYLAMPSKSSTQHVLKGTNVIQNGCKTASIYHPFVLEPGLTVYRF